MRAKPLLNLSSPRLALDTHPYSSFDQLDGSHPWKDLLPQGNVPYSVRQLQKGEIVYFNYTLAQEMGLISDRHPHKMNENLKKKIIETFSLQIINEYDLAKNKKTIPDQLIKKNKYMATRYLQLQHPSRVGKTSGDGRALWNGQIEFKNKTWDVSSRGTGVTCLAPGAVQAKKPLKTGSEEFGYGCGQAEMDELLGAAIMSEVFHLQGIATERVLCVIDLGGGVGIGVRAAPSLIRPAHLFLFLKQNRKMELKKAIGYFIQQQIKNEILPAHANLQSWLFQTAKRFAQFTAQLEAHYIFAWMDWDGDNILADAAIIDYGSVRQFGIRHDQYRYDDVDRFSTNLNEQKKKAQHMIQVFCQMQDYLSRQTSKRKSISAFKNHPAVKLFKFEYQQKYQQEVLYRMGFNQLERKIILAENKNFHQFFKSFSYLEKKKVSAQLKKLSDGVNRPALFSVQKGTSLILKNKIENKLTDPEDLFYEMRSEFAVGKDLTFKMKYKRPLQNFVKTFENFLKMAHAKNFSPSDLQDQLDRVIKINQQRLTGNALIHIVNDLIIQQKKSPNSLQKMMDQLIDQYLYLPEVETMRAKKFKPKMIYDPNLFEKMLNRLKLHQEDI